MLWARSDRPASGCRRRFCPACRRTCRSCLCGDSPTITFKTRPRSRWSCATATPPRSAISARASRVSERFVAREATREEADGATLRRSVRRAQGLPAHQARAEDRGDRKRRTTARRPAADRSPLRATDRRRRSRWAYAVRQEQASGRAWAARVALEVQRAGELVFGDGERADAHVKFFGHLLGAERSPRPKEAVGTSQRNSSQTGRAAASQRRHGARCEAAGCRGIAVNACARDLPGFDADSAVC